MVELLLGDYTAAAVDCCSRSGGGRERGSDLVSHLRMTVPTAHVVRSDPYSSHLLLVDLHADRHAVLRVDHHVDLHVVRQRHSPWAGANTGLHHDSAR